jgi:hypothetical protein
MKPGRKEIEQWIDNWIDRDVCDPFVVTPEQLYMLIGSHMGWDWDIEDVGQALVHEGTRYECMSPHAGLLKFLKETMTVRKLKSVKP